MSTGLLSIGSSALDAAYSALRTTGNNIANVNTPGYNREVVNFTAQTAVSTGSSYIGTGVTADAVTRVYSDFLAQQNNLAQSDASGADTTVQLTSQINALFSNTTGGLGASIDKFFTQLQALSAQPGSAAARTTTLSAAQEMAGQFNGAFSALQTMDQSVRQQLQQQVSSVNTTVGQISSLNDQIALATASGQSPNTLLDQRDQALLTLHQSLGVRTVSNQDGTIDIYLPNGQPLLVGDHAAALKMGQDPTDAQKLVVGTTSGSTIVALSGTNAGGSIGAMLQFQNTTLPSVESQIGRLAVNIASQVNAVQALGVDANGQVGANFFTTPTVGIVAAAGNTGSGAVTVTGFDTTQAQPSDYLLSNNGGTYTLTRQSDGQQTVLSGFPASSATVDGMTFSLSGTMNSGDTFTLQPTHFGAQDIGVNITQGAQIAAASPLQASVSTTGTLALGSIAPQGLASLPSPASNLLQPVTLTFTGPSTYSYTPTGASIPVTGNYTPGQPININGWSLTLSGTPANNDTVNITGSGAGSGSGDNRNALLMTQIQQAALVDGGTVDAGYAAVVGNVGAVVATAQSEQSSKDALLTSTTAAQTSLSGVNLDEEAAKLMQYQQMYQAAAKLVQTAGNIFDAIIAVAGTA